METAHSSIHSFSYLVITKFLHFSIDSLTDSVIRLTSGYFLLIAIVYTTSVSLLKLYELNC